MSHGSPVPRSDLESALAGGRPAAAPYRAPQEEATCATAFTFAWLNPLFRLGSVRVKQGGALRPADVPELSASMRARACEPLFWRHWDPARPSIWRALYGAFGWRLRRIVPLRLLFISLVLCSPQAVKQLLVALQDPDDVGGRRFVYAFLLYACFQSVSFAVSHNYMQTTVLGGECRAALMGAIYTKALRLRGGSGEGAGGGDGDGDSGGGSGGGATSQVGLVTADVERVWQILQLAPMLPTIVIIVTGGMVMLVLEIGAVGLAGAAVLLLLLPVQTALAKAIQRHRRRMAALGDERVALSAEVLHGIRSVKMAGLEATMHERVVAVREREVRELRAVLLLRSVNMVLSYAAPTVSGTAVFLLHAATGGDFDVTRTFTVLSILSVIRPPMSQLPTLVTAVAEALVAVGRMSKFFALPEVAVGQGEGRQGGGSAPAPAPAAAPAAAAAAAAAAASPPQCAPPSPRTPIAARLDAAACTWSPGAEAAAVPASSPAFVLGPCDVSFEAGKAYAVVGAVGAGKTSLLLALLGEMPLVAGRRQLGDDGGLGGAAADEGDSVVVAYAAQSPWIQSATVRENVLGGLPPDDARYAAAVAAAQLGPDVAQLADGGDTFIGERGVTLSGGQKARVALARALYRVGNADCTVGGGGNGGTGTAATTYLLLLDDVLAAVDAHVAAQLLDQVVLPPMPLASGSGDHAEAEGGDAPAVVTRVVVMSGNYDALARFDGVVLLADGKVVDAGPPEGVLERHPELRASWSADESAPAAADAGSAEEEGRREAAAATPATPTSAPDPQQQEHQEQQPAEQPAEPSVSPVSPAKGDGPLAEMRQIGALDLKLYLAYFAQASARVPGGAALGGALLACAAAEGARITSDWWLSRWAGDGTLPGDGAPPVGARSGAFWLATYGAWAGAVVLLALGRSLAFVRAALGTAVRMHDRLLARVLRASCARFFDVTPTGQLLNCFSKDLDSVDMMLSQYLHDFFQDFFFLSGVVLVCSASVPQFIPAIVPVLFVFLRVRAFFMQSNREIKRMESSSRAPVLSWFAETTHGLATVRAHGLQEPFAETYFAAVDANNRQFFSLYAMTPWMVLRLDSIAASVVCAVAFAVATFRDDMSSSAMGLAISYSVQLMGKLQSTVRLSIEMENHMVSVERLERLELVQPEEVSAADRSSSGSGKSCCCCCCCGGGDSDGDGDGGSVPTPPIAASVPEGWPAVGAVEARNVVVRYRPGLPVVLKGVSFALGGGESVGVCGRTGSGKSTLVGAFFRLVSLESGTILIDGVDIASLPLEVLRRRLGAVPQDPLLFEGSLRDNLDPGAEHDDAALLEALAAVQLGALAGTGGAAGLARSLGAHGGALSAGQRQLLCIARAMLRQSKVLLCDEATANVDSVTDVLIQRAMKKCFAGCTTITVAHRLDTIMHSHRILVFSAGKVVEDGAPAELLRREGGEFTALVAELSQKKSKKEQ